MPIPTPSGLVFTAPFVNSHNKVAIISGGARGQGATEAGLFAQEGAKVVLGDVLDEDGMTVEARIRELAVETTYLHLDLYNHCRLGSSRRNKPPFNNPIRRPSDSPFVNKGML